MRGNKMSEKKVYMGKFDKTYYLEKVIITYKL